VIANSDGARRQRDRRLETGAIAEMELEHRIASLHLLPHLGDDQDADRGIDRILDPVAAGNRPQIDSLRTFILQEARKGTEKDTAIVIYAEPKMAVPRKTI